MPRFFCLLIGTIWFAVGAIGHAGKSAKINYRLTVDPSDLSGYAVEIRLHNVPHVFNLAMATHNEYDDRFWRFVQNFHVSVPKGNASYIKSDSAAWQISIPGNEAMVSYWIHIPPLGQFRFAHRPLLSSMGGLIGDIHSFMYLPGNTQMPSTVTFQLPDGWQIATGLEPTQNDKTFIASSAEVLLDCPILVGYLHKWNFIVNGVKHTVAYLPTANEHKFDSIELVNHIQKIVLQAVKVFGNMPYHHYTFLLEDGLVGALEHQNSVTIGASSAMLATNMKELYGELAHEYFHTWNLMSIKPAEYSSLSYGPQQMSAGLWFSEGFTMFYADLLVRRAELPRAEEEDSTRLSHLQSLITRYYTDAGNTVIPPGKVSLASNAPPGMLGDYDASTHLQGELLAVMLDFIIRNASDNKKNLDDVMKLVFKEFGNRKGFYATDIEKASKNICMCDNKVDSFFKKYIYDGHAIDFNNYLSLAGLQLSLAYATAKKPDGRVQPDTRVYTWQPTGDSVYHIAVTTPATCWVKAGIHTGDVILALNKHPVKSRQDFYNVLNKAQVSDTLWVETMRNNDPKTVPVIITSYNKAVIRITQIAGSSTRQKELFERWKTGN